MTNVGQFCFSILIAFGILSILYVIFAPWLAQIDISKNTKSIAKELEEINNTMKDLKRSIERKEEQKKAKLLNANPVGECSACGWLIDYRDEFNFCPNCGADMRGEQDE